MGKKGYYLEFQYDDRGYGDLMLHNDSIVCYKVLSRTGSINRDGELLNAIGAGRWTIKEKAVNTDESAMVLTPGFGWKIRLFNPEGLWTRYLIHPDAGLPGTRGCIGLVNDDCPKLREMLDMVLNRQDEIPVYINTPVPAEGV